MSERTVLHVKGLDDVRLAVQYRDRGPVAIGIPMLDYIPRGAFWEFGHLFMRCRIDDKLLPTYETAVAGEARNVIIRAFLALPPSYRFLFLFDSDMVVPLNCIEAMTYYDLPFVSGYCVRKTYPYHPVPAMYVKAWERDGETVHEYHPVSNWELRTGIRECDGVGAAFLCLRRDLLEAIPAPWFKHEGGGEDYYFCRKVKATKLPGYAHGVPIRVDTHLVAGHIGESVAWPQDYFTVKPKYMEETGNTEVPIETEIPTEIIRDPSPTA